MVEMAITLIVFMMLVFAIFEMAILLYTMSKANEATRAGSRYAIVHDPVTDLSVLSCPATPEVSVSCGGTDCGPMLEKMQALLPWISADNVRVTYRCSSAGFPGRPESMAIRQVEVALTDVTYRMAVPNLIGVQGELTLPDFRYTRTTEDLHTPSAP